MVKFKRISCPADSFEERVQKWLSGESNIKVWGLTLVYRFDTNKKLILSALIQYHVLEKSSNVAPSEFKLFVFDGSDTEIQVGMNEWSGKESRRGISPVYDSCCHQEAPGAYQEFHAIFRSRPDHY